MALAGSHEPEWPSSRLNGPVLLGHDLQLQSLLGLGHGDPCLYAEDLGGQDGRINPELYTWNTQ